MDRDPMRKNPVVLKLKSLDIATAAIDRPLRIRRIEAGGLHTPKVLDLQRQQRTRPLYKLFEFANDMHGTSLRTTAMEDTSVRSTRATAHAGTTALPPAKSGVAYRPAGRSTCTGLIWRSQS